MITKEQKLVKIFPREYWEEDKEKKDISQYSVNGKPFWSSLDDDIDTCQMKKFFGGVYQIQIYEQETYLEIKERPKYFVIINQNEYDIPHTIFEWDLCAIEKDLNPEDYPEYYL